MCFPVAYFTFLYTSIDPVMMMGGGSVNNLAKKKSQEVKPINSTIWLFNIAMENPLQMEVLMGKPSIN